MVSKANAVRCTAESGWPRLSRQRSDGLAARRRPLALTSRKERPGPRAAASPRSRRRRPGGTRPGSLLKRTQASAQAHDVRPATGFDLFQRHGPGDGASRARGAHALGVRCRRTCAQRHRLRALVRGAVTQRRSARRFASESARSGAPERLDPPCGGDPPGSPQPRDASLSAPRSLQSGSRARPARKSASLSRARAGRRRARGRLGRQPGLASASRAARTPPRGALERTRRDAVRAAAGGPRRATRRRRARRARSRRSRRRPRRSRVRDRSRADGRARRPSGQTQPLPAGARDARRLPPRRARRRVGVTDRRVPRWKARARPRRRGAHDTQAARRPRSVRRRARWPRVRRWRQLGAPTGVAKAHAAACDGAPRRAVCRRAAPPRTRPTKPERGYLEESWLEPALRSPNQPPRAGGEQRRRGPPAPRKRWS